LFKAAGVTGLPALKRHRNDSIAIQAAWEEVTLTVPEMPERAVRLDGQKLRWFLGFLEGRTRIQAPDWWVEMLMDSRANAGDNIYPGKSDKHPYDKAGLGAMYAPIGTTLKREDGDIELRVGKEAVKIPASVFPRGRAASALMTPRYAYVAIHGQEGYPYFLFCMDRQTSKVAWKTRVWANSLDVAGVSRMWVSVSEQDGRIVVFGAGSAGLHIESFRADNGENLSRFSSAN